MIVACLAVTIGFASCDKDDTSKKDVFLLEEILYLGSSDIYRHDFEYDSHERIIKSTYYNKNDLPLFVNSLIYNADGDLVEVTLNFFEEFSSFPDRTTKFIKIDNMIYANYGVIIELNGQGLPVKYKIYEREETLTWKNGNLVKRTIVDEGSTQYQVISTFTHDNMKSPFYHCKTPKWFFIWFMGMGGFERFCNDNNMIDEELIVNGEFWNTFPFDYTYNNNGFAASSKQQKTVTTSVFRYLKR